MSISAAMYTGVTGLKTMGTALSVIGNDIANVNTVGYKEAQVQFMDLLSQSISTTAGSSQIGKGVTLGTVNNVFSQGSFVDSEEDTDLAINGDGFFIISDPDTNSTFYTRAGNFTLDNEGRLITPHGYTVQGWSIDDEGQMIGAPTDIVLTTGTLPPVMTSEVTFITNLQADASSQIASLWQAWDGTADNPINGDSYVYQSSVMVYDSLGNARNLTIYYDPLYNPPQASLTTNLAGINNDITYTAITGGSSSNNTSITYVDPSPALNQPLSIAVVGNDITVNLGTDGFGVVNTTADDIVAAIAADTAASNLVSAVAEVPGTGVVTAMATTNLAGGSDINTTPHQWEYIIATDPEDDSRVINGNSVIGSESAGLLMRGIVTFDPNTGGIANTPTAITAEEITDIDTINVPPNPPTWTGLTPNNNGYFEITANFIPGTTDQTIELNLGANNQLGLNNWVTESLSTTQYASASSTLFQGQDGYASSYLQGIGVDTDGIIYGEYSNGQSVATYQIALALFQSEWGLEKLGENLYNETLASGSSAIAPAGQGGAGDLFPNALEQSNVDLAKEFVDMIIIQRAFQANSKVITTTDQMMAELINLKR
ncbi:MAG: flagellar hook protein FlgE [Deltaproteobacteria bacterium]|nr:flagellar hook protein FlgE [Deltaproteobacteria bacterium]MBW2050841.1 flagellar hook protein FlgE [Deltaproteobacteria bacterium]MBW2140065.1 flagellar hook protein FlgE [Deltaproteobacteria bacterium]MBW2322069.1 flagellar hook protein FlgE [Deltaproteobacteria bacterium]